MKTISSCSGKSQFPNNVSNRVKTAAEYEAKAKELRRKEKAFIDEVSSRWDELKVKLKKQDDFDLICEYYGVTNPEQRKILLNHIMSDRQRDYFYGRFGHPSQKENATSMRPISD